MEIDISQEDLEIALNLLHTHSEEHPETRDAMTPAYKALMVAYLTEQFRLEGRLTDD